jgi:hypothetical protein
MRYAPRFWRPFEPAFQPPELALFFHGVLLEDAALPG